MNGEISSLETAKKLKDQEEEIKKINKENDRLINILNELEKYLNENKFFYGGYLGEDLELDISIKLVLDKLQELKESNK